MNSIRTSFNRRLILDRFSSSDLSAIESYYSAKIIRLKQEDVVTIFIISSESVDSGAYFQLVKRYESEGFRVRNIHVERLDDMAIPGVKKIVEEISNTFRKETCMVISYGRSLASLIVACYYVYTGTAPSKAISRVWKMDAGFITSGDEVAFVYRFKHFLSLIQGIRDDEYILKPLHVKEFTDVQVPFPAADGEDVWHGTESPGRNIIAHGEK